jgi:hypothetical protein
MDDAWREEALCATPTFKELARLAGACKDPSEVFFPITEDDKGREFPQHKPRDKRYKMREARFERLARTTCAVCPVRLECLFSTMELEEAPYGIAGGMDPENRGALLDQESPRIHKRECVCGIVLYGAKGHVPSACSANCRGAK